MVHDRFRPVCLYSLSSPLITMSCNTLAMLIRMVVVVNNRLCWSLFGAWLIRIDVYEYRREKLCSLVQQIYSYMDTPTSPVPVYSTWMCPYWIWTLSVEIYWICFWFFIFLNLVKIGNNAWKVKVIRSSISIGYIKKPMVVLSWGHLCE